MCPEDFVVREIPAYAPDGRVGAHLLLTLTKRGIGSEDAILELSRQTGIPRPEIGLAGLKDNIAVTEQWISVPFAAGPALAEFSHPAITLGPAHPHGNKLRRGHLHGNRFILVVRELAVPAKRPPPASPPSAPASPNSAASTTSTASSGWASTAATSAAASRPSTPADDAAAPTSC
jgi:tRNA(Glu) U13 pseudouridine synthase TruD